MDGVEDGCLETSWGGGSLSPQLGLSGCCLEPSTNQALAGAVG